MLGIDGWADKIVKVEGIYSFLHAFRKPLARNWVTQNVAKTKVLVRVKCMHCPCGCRQNVVATINWVCFSPIMSCPRVTKFVDGRKSERSESFEHETHFLLHYSIFGETNFEKVTYPPE